MAALFLCYSAAALSASRGDICAGDICYLWGFKLLVYCCMGGPFIGFACDLGGLLCSFHFSPFPLLQRAHEQRVRGG